MEKRFITMRCNKKQFKKIRPKLEGKVVFKNLSEFSDRLDFYLINHLCDEINTVTNVTCPRKEEGIYFFEEWNEKIFLEACGIEVEKSKEETFLITKEQIKQLHFNGSLTNQEDLEGMFPIVFETELVVGKWYKSLSIKGSLFEYLGNGKARGFFQGVEWDDEWSYPERSVLECRYATNKEVEEVIKGQCIKLGIKEGVFIKRDFDDCLVDCFINIYSYPKDSVWYYNSEEDYLEHYGFVVYSKGKFAKVVPTITIQEAEQKLNCKII